MTVLAQPKTDDSSTACGAACDCSPAPAPKRHLSWPATLAWVAAGSVLCLIIIKVFGV